MFNMNHTDLINEAGKALYGTCYLPYADAPLRNTQLSVMLATALAACGLEEAGDIEFNYLIAIQGLAHGATLEGEPILLDVEVTELRDLPKTFYVACVNDNENGNDDGVWLVTNDL